MRRRRKALPANFLRVDESVVLRLLSLAKSSERSLQTLVEETVTRGLHSLECEKTRAATEEVDWFTHLVETGSDLEPWQKAVLDLTFQEEGIWTTAMPPSDASVMDVRDEAFVPHLDIDALRCRWAALVAEAHSCPDLCA